MEKFIVDGPTKLVGNVTIAGAKNVALKALVASLLTDEEVIIDNVPQIRDVHLMIEVLEHLGKHCTFKNSTITIKKNSSHTCTVPLEVGARLRTSSMVLGPLLSRYGKAIIPNPGGCRIGARPIDRHIEGLKAMGASISYASADGYFHAKVSDLHGAEITFEKNTHTGTETLLLAAILAKGTTILHNAAQEVEVDDLIELLRTMGAAITRTANREIIVEGVSTLHGTTYTIMPDRNEEVTFAVAAIASTGDITVHNSRPQYLAAFLKALSRAGGGWEEIDTDTTRYFYKGELQAVDVVTGVYPGFMTDWQAPWALLMTQAKGESVIHETVFENRFAYVEELKKMGAKIAYFDPKVKNPEEFYNFNWNDHIRGMHQAIRITGPTNLHNAIVSINDLRAGATLLLATTIGSGKSYLYGIEQVDRGYEHIENRLTTMGAHIERVRGDALS
ncbi:MAG: UDP-N-acetylglucosamine 1-carboxyvinyltransferase [Microgenomates group bacterium GW2011_GWC1_43_11]|uniref:UDP-N-acetylglucosamine 1-carboxyvinyltransferase n=2 Tax=Candidatus Gottesmaniibacteriota TaxID=1752720 RepID=A0A0G1KYC3_9BACT|nr:MAG: UDP-N-acetylglucosamine 1-carboxyvinyltransferase [Microgenomates group bacterium GW2011_GWC1_43_11]KKT38759.1 MAG: UDP-N-acetylglucosamine 1-carboxyvinyltransferase [Candidatus Gottesmanbacteria bacterium GW2011_GWB1_44_11c]KKT61342.1 MAG: UDP-N-acetylglucosamine 1-carboxyvinyltransferase [Candidatus Gottesmanbacteria bacterium GW2011_GWA1_44_24b]HCM82890.1 UDP-N-acetylglucosamine 1-carboxyvinyltransferase [Patescibacteria group bacterium]